MVKTRLYTSEDCPPCKVVADKLKQQGGIIDGEEIEVIDVETDEGFEAFSNEVLRRGDGAVPSAYKGGKKCDIIIDEGTGVMHLECPATDQEASLAEAG